MRFPGRTVVAVPSALVALLVIGLWQPIGQLVEFVRRLQPAPGLSLVPALVAVPLILLLYQVRRGQEARAAAVAAADTARAADERAAEMERLTVFSQAVARSLDHVSITGAVTAHLADLAPGRDIWVMVHGIGDGADGGTGWQTLAAVGQSSPAARERAARAALGDHHPVVGVSAEICFPMIVAGRPVGVLGVAPDPPVSNHLRSVLNAAAALLAVSLQNADLFREVREHSVRDPLTGCYRRAHALEVLATELRRARRSGLPMSVMMLDLDTFKEINDTCGHLAGDAVLAALGMRMRSVLRGSDVKCRYGGDEFLVILPETPADGARRVAESLRRDLEHHQVQWGGEALTITASFGVTTSRTGEVDATSVLARADAALYAAKAAGRNCVRYSEEPVGLLPAQLVHTL